MPQILQKQILEKTLMVSNSSNTYQYFFTFLNCLYISIEKKELLLLLEEKNGEYT